MAVMYERFVNVEAVCIGKCERYIYNSDMFRRGNGKCSTVKRDTCYIRSARHKRYTVAKHIRLVFKGSFVGCCPEVELTFSWCSIASSCFLSSYLPVEQSYIYNSDMFRRGNGKCSTVKRDTCYIRSARNKRYTVAKHIRLVFKGSFVGCCPEVELTFSWCSIASSCFSSRYLPVEQSCA
jgi:hypothetical protein